MWGTKLDHSQKLLATFEWLRKRKRKGLKDGRIMRMKQEMFVMRTLSQ